MGLWYFVTRLGEIQLLAPAVGLGVWLLGHCAPGRAVAVRWLLGLLAASMLTAASKVAFMGWGYGVARWDFTGLSGHAMYAAAIYPVLLAVMAVWVFGAAGRGWGALAGAGVALVVGWSRIEVHAHSGSEVALGLLAGALVSALVLRHFTTVEGGFSRLTLALPVVLPVVLGVWLGLGVHWAPPPRTHQWVTALALRLSGHERPFTRLDLHRSATHFTDPRG
jgi:membrane-associated phospholipid phosphatase